MTGRAILDILLDFVNKPTTLDSPYNRMSREWRRTSGAPVPKRWRYNQAIAYLEQQEQISLVRKNNEIFVKLTQEGKLRALMQRLYEGLDKKKIWDGKWRLAIWDIPEDSRDERDRLRAFLKELGFNLLQQSVFVTPYPLPATAVQYLNESGLSRYIRFLRVDKIDDDRFLRRHFGLNTTK